jgi:hypothetical protein
VAVANGKTTAQAGNEAEIVEQTYFRWRKEYGGLQVDQAKRLKELEQTAGWLGVVQGKLVINLTKGLNVPLAIKWSNKTDLLQATDVRGQIGVSYDLSALSKLIAGGTAR